MNNRLFSAVCLYAVAWVAHAQHETGFDVIDGRQAYQSICANCHGPDGDLINGVDLGHGTFRQPYTDAQLADIILKGIPNTPMPPNPTMGEEQAVEIVAYLRSLALTQSETLAGDPERGRALFAGKGDCFSCHRIAGQGSGLGPELTRIGASRTSAELQESLLDPEARVLPNQRFYSVVTGTDERVTGRLLNHDAFSVQLLDTSERLRSFDKSNLREHGFTSSGMPALVDYDAQEIADLVAYLTSLRGTNP